MPVRNAKPPVRSWNTLRGDILATTSNLPEGSGLYFTNARADARIALIPLAGEESTGLLHVNDWNNFNNAANDVVNADTAATGNSLVRRTYDGSADFYTCTATLFHGSGAELTNLPVGKLSGSVAAFILKPNGAVIPYVAAADTDIARGNALVAAVQAAGAGDTVLIGPGTFDLGNQFLTLVNVNLTGAGWQTVIKSAAVFSAGVLILEGTIRLRDFKIVSTLSTDYSRLVAATIPGSIAGITLTCNNVFFDGTTDVFLQDFGASAVVAWAFHDCVLRSQWDVFVHHGQFSSVGSPITSLTADFWNCEIIVTSNSPVGPGQGTGLRAYIGTWNFHNCSIRVTSTYSGGGEVVAGLQMVMDNFDDGITPVPGVINLYATEIITASFDPTKSKDMDVQGGVVNPDAACVYNLAKIAAPIKRKATFGLVNPADSRRASAITKTANVSLTNMVTFNLEAAKNYRFRIYLYVDASAAGGHKYALGGTAVASAIIYQMRSINSATGAVVLCSRQTAMAVSMGENASGATSLFTEIIGTVAVSTAGTFLVQFAQNTASGVSTLLIGSFVEIAQI